ncbi:hypothetical protein [Legionella waltersii]|uniref:Uncharacterized protein n=1 Tax=Legionella waltersii TaxID=66969 RepID=A0A0W1A758_9GAMM|nr:hypothetical protein [Legionella waltersii]KTD77169.1 hypothetical protein Lwal_1946 [Legionella waltersii]SNV11356.1 Uncharacterised protein [Legionella waltersii]
MSVHFVSETVKKTLESDKSLKLGDLRAGVYFVDQSSAKEFIEIVGELHKIDGIQTSRHNADEYRVRLSASKLDDQQALQEIMVSIKSKIANEAVVESMITAIETLTGVKMNAQKTESSDTLCLA